MSKKGKQWCAVPGCMSIDIDIIHEKRHFFRFPKEHDRWLKWIKASKRLDLELKGPNYAYRNCTICHFHFEEKWLIRKTMMRLNPDAISTIFFGPAFDRENTDLNERMQIEEIQITTEQEGSRSDMQCMENQRVKINVDGNSININNVGTNMHASNMNVDNEDAVRANNMDTVNAKVIQNTSNSTQKMKKSSNKSLRQKKLLEQIKKLKKQNNKLRQTIRRLRLKEEKKKIIAKKEEVNDAENMRELSGKLFSGNFLKLLSAQIDALTKNKRGRRYDSDFKQFALSLFFSGPHNYRELIKHFALPSVRSLQLFTQSWKIVPGINDKIFEALSEIFQALPPIERHCILAIDEITLKSHFIIYQKMK